MAAAAFAEPLALYYNDRPPYLVTAPDGKSVTGLTATPAARALTRAGIEFTWIQLPSSRQMAAVKANAAPVCAVGWFRNAERERFARFTDPIYRDRPTVGLAHPRFVPPSTRLDELLGSPGVRVLLKDGYSYGPYIDQLLARSPAVIERTTGENVNMIQMVASARADLMFAAAEEAGYLVDQAGVRPEQLKLVHFDDVPDGEQRHIMCSQRVPAETIQRINKAIGAA